MLIFAQWQRCTYRGPVRRRSRVRLRTEEPLFLFLSFFFFRLVFLVIVVLFCFVSLDSDSFFPFENYLPSCPISLAPYFLPFPRCAPRGPAIYVFLVLVVVTCKTYPRNLSAFSLSE